MQAEVWKRVEELFRAAQGQSPDKRREFLKQACPDDARICAEVQSLLDAESSVESFLDSSPLSSALARGTMLGHFEILDQLGRGGMGEVYRAKDKRLNRTVAIKILSRLLSTNPRLRDRFEREARAISALNHPHICTLHDIGRENDLDFLVMEHLDGETLAKRVTRGPLPLEQMLRYAIEIADALDSAHKHGVLHRDLKPGNIMLTKSGAKVLDFGLAKMQGAETAPGATRPASALTEKGIILGTLPYMAPEQLEGKEAGPRTDIFAFGTVLYEMSTGKRAFAGESRASLIAAILEHEPPPLTALQPMTPAALDHVLKKCLAKDPDTRWQTARDLKDELEWIAGQNAAAAVNVSRDRKQARLAWAAASVLAIVAMLVAIMLFREKPPQTRLVRFSIYPPEKATFANPLALSPDGTRLALIASASGAEPLLWVRRLDSLTAQPFPGTEGADDPFWSPDGQFIAFFAGGKLKKIEASGGGAVETLCDARDGHRGTWNRAGVILFPLNNALYRVAAEGGSAIPVTAISQSNQQSAPLWPHFLPDGRRFLYTVITSNRRDDSIQVGSLDSKESKRLLASHWMAAYAPASNDREGHLLFVRDDNLMAQRFDATHLWLTGEPVLLAARVSDFVHVASFSVAANGTLAYSPASADKTQLTWFDRAGKKLGTVGLATRDVHAALSPDGKRVAVSRGEPESGINHASSNVPFQPSDIWILDLQGGTASRLTFDSCSDYPVWSSDGNRIAYSSNRNGHMDIYQRAANGAGGEDLLMKSNEDKYATDFSRNGQFLTYSILSPRTAFDIWLLPLIGKGKSLPLLQTQFGEVAGQFTPDSKWMAYQSNDSGRWAIYVRPLAADVGQGDQSAAGRWPISNGDGIFPRWRGDGKELFYLGSDDRIMAAEVSMGQANGQPTFEAGIPKQLFTAPIIGHVPFTVTPDGQRFLVNTQTGEEKSSAISVVLNWPALLKHSRR